MPAAPSHNDAVQRIQRKNSVFVFGDITGYKQVGGRCGTGGQIKYMVDIIYVRYILLLYTNRISCARIASWTLSDP